MKRIPILLLAVLCTAASALHLGYDAANGMLTDLSAEGYRRLALDGTTLAADSLVEDAWVYTSPSGNYLLLAEFHEAAPETRADLRLLDAAGDELWSHSEVPFASARLADDGRVALVEFRGGNPGSPARLTLLDPAGAVVGDLEVQPLGQSDFSTDGSLFLANVPGRELAVYDAVTAELRTTLPTSQVFAADGDYVLVAEKNTALLYERTTGRQVRFDTGVELPRHAELDGEGFVVAGMDDVYLFRNGRSRYAAVAAGYSLASLDTAAGLTTIALGGYRLHSEGGALWLFDGELNLTTRIELDDEGLGGPLPQVVLTPEELWVKFDDELRSYPREVNR
ncbi:MAG: hypothetical protein GF399_04875 [Candidatus Coatesbacteria bacterium]|nr:hypothetical protein [Candidatus Coatesbacteria bacterium]